MKNIFTPERKIGIAIIALFTILWIILVFILFDTAHPNIKHRILVSGMATGSLAFVSLLCIRFLYKKKPLFTFGSLCSRSKLCYSIKYLVLSVFFIGCIEYLIYQTDKEQFSIEQEYLDKSLQDRADNIAAELEIYQHYENKYEQLLSRVLSENDYDCLKINNKIITLVDGDTLIIHLHRVSPMTPRSSIYHKKEDIDYYRARSIGISIPGESYNLSHPSSQKALNSMKLNGYIQGANLAELIHKKELFYNQRRIKHEELLANNQIITFWAFLIYNFFNYSSIAKGTNIIIRILVLLQTIIITFLSGYIYKTLYKMMDGE